MLVCLLISLIGLDGVGRSWRWLPLVAMGFVGGLLIKGVFAVLVLSGAAWWVLFNPTGGSRTRQVVACRIALVCMVLAGLAYDVWYLRETGSAFWSAYWRRQLGPMRIASPLTEARVFGAHVGFYILRLLFHPALEPGDRLGGVAHAAGPGRRFARGPGASVRRRLHRDVGAGAQCREPVRGTLCLLRDLRRRSRRGRRGVPNLAGVAGLVALADAAMYRPCRRLCGSRCWRCD
jgi:hypothetical protein